MLFVVVVEILDQMVFCFRQERVDDGFVENLTANALQNGKYVYFPIKLTAY